MKPKCNICTEELKEFGAILLSPPDDEDLVKKYHICKKCFKKLEKRLS